MFYLDKDGNVVLVLFWADGTTEELPLDRPLPAGFAECEVCGPKN